MKEYAVHWIRDEFAYRYFYKSDILYRFIKLYQKNKYNYDLSRQYNYITKEFSKSFILSHLIKNKQDHVSIKSQQNELMIHRQGQEQTVYLSIDKKQLTFYCEMIDDAEDLLFPSLRLISPYLFVIGVNASNYGWISPVKKGIKYKSGQLLYSNL